MSLLIRHVRVLVALALVAAPFGCAAETSSSEDGTTGTTAEAITNGTDDDADPSAVALLIGGKLFCTGVLVTPTIVATAGHCISPTPPEQVYFGSDPTAKKKGTMIAVSDSKVHPDFDEDSLVNDIGLIGLASKAPVAPANIYTGDFDASFKGLAVRLVGFGAQGVAQDGNLRKRSGQTSIDSFGDDDFRFHPTPSQTCNGDSGGPAFATVNGKELVIGLASSGDQSCKTYGRDMRIDRYVPFIKSYVKTYSAAAAAGADANGGCTMTPRAPSRGSSGATLALLAAAILLTRARARRAHT